ncbi:MAG: Gfo/Idh/MocA family oxidoreductase, partial [Verrucomicrobiota bacterium]
WGDWRKTPAWLWRQSSKHGSKGVLGDVGVHIVDFATFPIDSQVKKVNCQLKTFNNIKGKKHDGYTLDANDSAFIRCELANGAVGIIQTSRWATGYANNLHLEVFGEKGALKIDLDHSYDDFEVCTGKDIHKAEWKTIKCKPAPDNFARFIKSIRTGKNDQPDFAKGTEIQKVLDACFDSDRSGKTVSVR